jgi:tRNA pseudouridine38-40 synthase
LPRYALTLAYDGTDFSGWQKQEPLRTATLVDASRLLPPAPTDTTEPGRVQLRTVQAVLERAVREAVREPVMVVGASRTDAGVHAMGQVAAFSCSGDALPSGEECSTPVHAAGEATSRGTGRGTGWPASRGPGRLINAINSRLPADVTVLDARVVPDDFDPVRWALRKQYVYSFRISKHLAMFDRNRVYCVHDALDVDRMRSAAQHLLGTHDCLGLTSAQHGRMTTVRTIEACDVRCYAAPAEGALPDIDPSALLVQVRVCGTGFLYNMVRIIAGTLLDVGRGRLHDDVFARVYRTLDRRLAGPTLPANGLCLEWIEHAMSRPATLDANPEDAQVEE